MPALAHHCTPPLRPPLASLPAVLGTSSQAGSQVGSLKSFAGTSWTGKRLFASESDLAAASMPSHATAPIHAGRRRVAPAPDKNYNLVRLASTHRQQRKHEQGLPVCWLPAGEGWIVCGSASCPPHGWRRCCQQLAAAGQLPRQLPPNHQPARQPAPAAHSLAPRSSPAPSLPLSPLSPDWRRVPPCLSAYP